MSRIVTDPPVSARLPDGAVLGGWWHDDPAQAGRIVCDLCPRACALRPGDRAFCFVRENRDGRMVLTTYGHSTGFCIDPIEKKPLNHFHPGTSVLSFGTAGCNLGCKFCQNWSISKSREIESLSESASPEAIAQAALKLGCRSVAFTYNDPVIWAEYAIDTAKACRAAGVKSVAVTAGYITPHSRGAFYEAMDAANVDLKGFSEEFYQKLTLSHLQPVLDTLVWLKRETNVWFEITNLIIPQANDSRDELARMCDWMYEHLGPYVPVHFTAFHPDFRLRDRGRTPAETLFAAYEIAAQRGLNYVYVGNLANSVRQTTRCPNCREAVIERSSYEILSYSVQNGACGHCGSKIDGRFEDTPGDWGARRQPVRISEFERSVGNAPQTLVQLGQGYEIRQRAAVAPAKAPPAASSAPNLSPAQQSAVLAAAAEILTAEVHQRPAAIADATLAGAAALQVMGCFVTAKRNGMLRSCCGFMGSPDSIAQAVQRAARRTASDDHRFPPISPSELPYLHLDVWLLFDPQLMTARGDARSAAIVIGQHGLQIARGQNRGLLLPGVAVEHQLDAEQFLQHVCLKAGLPAHAWKDDDVQLSTFEGIAIEGPLPSAAPTDAAPKFTRDDVTTLAQLCRHNLLAHLDGGTPSPYAFNANDGEARGVVLSLRSGGSDIASVSRYALREALPVQATLYMLVQELSRELALVEKSALSPFQVELAILDDVAMHGTCKNFDRRGYEPGKRGLLIAGRGRSGFVWDAELTADQALSTCRRAAGWKSHEGTVYSAAVVATTNPIVAGDQPRPQIDTGVRPAAVAGSFYPSDPQKLTALVDQLLAGPVVEKKRYPAVMVPHAGLKYSGKIAAEVLRRVEFPSTVILIGPKHTPHGVDWAIAPHEAWSIPGATLSGDPDLARQLVAAIPGLELDAAAHAQEHGIEVELPLIARLAPQAKVVGIAIGSGNYADCRRFAAGLAQVLRQREDRPLLVISSDMNHFASDAENRRLDELALACINRLDAEALLATCRKQQISMCGVLPAVIVMETLRELGQLQRVQRIAYATSGDVSGDKSRVVGYAGVAFEAQ